MISALILPLFLAGPQANTGGAPRGDPAIRLWINNDGRFLPGDHAEVQVRTRDDGYLLVLQAAPDGQLRVLFPLDPGDDNFVRGGERYDVKGRDGREAFDIDGSWGRGMVYAAISREQFRFDGYRLGDHWDYRALAPFQLPREPEPELTDLVSRMAPGDFDYDVVAYDVIEHVVYASDYSPFLFAFDPFFFEPFFHRRFFFDPFLRRRLFVDPFFRRPFFEAHLTPWRARGAAAPSGGPRVELRGEGPVRLAVPDARQRAIENRRDNWPVDVSPRRREPVAEARLANWPVDVSPRSQRLANEAGLANWPVDVSPRRRNAGLPTGRRAVGDHSTEIRPPIDGTSRVLVPWSPHQPQGYAPGPRPAPYGPIGLPHR